LARFPRNLHDIFQDAVGVVYSAHKATTDCIATSQALRFFLAAGQGAASTLRIAAVTPAGDEKAR
jgi:hypothetical protein